ncbi:MAG: DUF1275 domain-containing protein [Pseudomonas fluorescens]|nr:MAG: DUF1275 domain-containing protein [Pseudomonas fluorescens]
MLHPLRTPKTDFRLGLFLATLAGAVNAGGFLAIGQYTSHLTGMVATAADMLVLHHWDILILAVTGVISFMGGAVLASLFVNWGERHRPHHRYALPLAFEGVLIIIFGLYGLFMPPEWQIPICGIMLLGMLMGLQNGTGGLITNLRTTHHTGTLNDIATELGHLIYRCVPRRRTTHNIPLPLPNYYRLKVNTTMILSFITGSVVGAFGFLWLGMGFAIPIGVLLLVITVPVLASAPRD